MSRENQFANLKLQVAYPAGKSVKISWLACRGKLTKREEFLIGKELDEKSHMYFLEIKKSSS